MLLSILSILAYDDSNCLNDTYNLGTTSSEKLEVRHTLERKKMVFLFFLSKLEIMTLRFDK